MQRQKPFSRATWNIYLGFLAIRVFLALSSGYIHPDEFFQSAEITAGNVFGLDVNIPWEYKPELPCRSILTPAVTTGLPYLLLRIWMGTDPDHFVTSRALFITQRLASVIVSLVIDWSIVQMARQIRRSPSIALLLVSSSYVTLAYHTHPFSNLVETAVLALSAVVLGKIIQRYDASTTTPSPIAAKERVDQNLTKSHPSSSPQLTTITPPSISTGLLQPNTSPAPLTFLLGVLFAIGLFTRITFVIFGFPFGLMLLYINARASFSNDKSKLVGLATFIRACMPLAVGLSTTSVIALLIDSIYFGKLIVARHSNSLPMSLWEIFTMNPLEWSTLSVHGSLTLAMLNNLQYNLDKENLALHGLHPRYLHLLVNFPVLFGNLAWIGVTTIISKILAGEWTSQSKLVTALTYSGICGLAVLSSMPHQEARFLTPLILPLIVALSGRISRLGRKFWPLWLVMNSVLAIVFSIFHQGGLVPAIDLVQKQSLSFQNCKAVGSPNMNHIMCSIDEAKSGVYHAKDENTYSTRVVFYKTYMPPHHLFGYNLPRAHAHGVQLDILDWRNMTKEQLLHDLYSSNGNNDRAVDRQLLRAARNMTRIKQNAVLFRQVGPGHFERTLLITPGTVDFSDQEFDRDDTKDWISHHANLDHLPELLQRPLSGLRLNVYYL